MTEVLFTGEVVAGLLGLLLVVALALIVRRRLIGRDAELVVCALRVGGRPRTRTGLLRMTADRLEWYPLFGVTPRARHRWERRGLDMGAPTPSEPDRNSLVGLIPAAVLVPCQARGRAADDTFELVLAPASYTALRAWAEAAPPRGGLPA